MNVSPRQNPAYRLSRRAIHGARCALASARRAVWRVRWPLSLLLWTALISGLSHISLPSGRGSPLFPGADKLIHIAEFALFALIAWKAFRRRALPVLAVGLAFAAVDEIHQAFVPTRIATLFDAAADALGVLLGLALARWGPRLWAFLHRRILDETESTTGG